MSHDYLAKWNPNEKDLPVERNTESRLPHTVSCHGKHEEGHGENRHLSEGTGSTVIERRKR